jgi:hypothetical protein
VPPGPPPVARRTTLALGVTGLLGLAACDDGDSEPRSAPTPAADPDSELVERVLADLRGALRLAVAASLHDLAELHRAHITALDGDLAPAGPGRRLAGRARALAEVRARETRLHRQLVEAAVAADSGRLARLLASMSAAVSQRLATLPGVAG